MEASTIGGGGREEGYSVGIGEIEGELEAARSVVRYSEYRRIEERENGAGWLGFACMCFSFVPMHGVRRRGSVETEGEKVEKERQGRKERVAAKYMLHARGCSFAAFVGGTETVAGDPRETDGKGERGGWSMVERAPTIGTPFSKTKPDLTLIYRRVLPRCLSVLRSGLSRRGELPPARINPLSGSTAGEITNSGGGSSVQGES